MSKYRITLEGKTYEMEVELVPEEAAPQTEIRKEYREFRGSVKDPTVRVIDPSAERQTIQNTGVVTAPMPGTIIEIKKQEGAEVRRGEIILILEAMKMENEIAAPSDGTLIKVTHSVGDTVAGGEILFEVK